MKYLGKELTWLIAGVLVIGILIGVMLSCAVLASAMADGDGYYEAFVLCQPDSYVNVREKPKKASAEVGMMDCGDRFLTDGRQKNGFLHIVNAGTETGDGWIYAGYVVYDQPERVYERREIAGKGRVACRKWVGGKRRAWAKPGSAVTVYWISYEWAVTSRGFIRAEWVGGAE